MSRWPRAERAFASRGWYWLVPATLIVFVGCQTDRIPSEPVPEASEQLSASASKVM
jgi:hypothetical protein